MAYKINAITLDSFYSKYDTLFQQFTNTPWKLFPYLELFTYASRFFKDEELYPKSIIDMQYNNGL